MRGRLRDWLLVSSLTALAVAFIWPLSNLQTPTLPAHDDALFSVWRLAWVARQLVVDPARLFDANIFWPEQRTLAFSDAMLLLGAAGAPLIWLGVHPIVVHNVLLLASFVSAGYAMLRLLRYLGVGVPGQLIGATIFACAPYRIGHIGHLELLWTAFLPLAVLYLYRLIEAPTMRRGLALGMTLGLQALTSIYYFVFLVMWLAPAVLLAWWHRRATVSRRHLRATAIALLTTAVIVLPYFLVYANVRQRLGQRSDAEVQRYSAMPTDYLSVPSANRLYESLRTEPSDERALFLGAVALILVAVSVWRRTRAATVFAVLGALAVDLSFGVHSVTYSAARVVLPPLDNFRAPARFAVFALLSVSVLAGLAVNTLLATIRRWGVRQAVFALILSAVLFEYWSAPLPTAAMPMAPPAVYAWLSTQAPTVTLEWPVPTPDALWKFETTYEYFAIYHWQPLVNGYSGYAPRSYVRLLDAIRDFPSPASLDVLSSRGVQLILLHERLMEPGAFDRLVVACQDPTRYTEVRMFDDTVLQRSAACRLAPLAQSAQHPGR